LEFEAGESLSLTTEPILLCGKSHKYQLFVRERHVEPEFRERDGMFICPKDDAVILLSAKARFGPAERNELIRDITCGKRATAVAVGEAEDGGEGFIINDWLFETTKERRCMRFQGLRSTVGSTLLRCGRVASHQRESAGLGQR
jgi:hypothetical protein